MDRYEFTIILDRIPTVVEQDTVFAGHDDAAVERRGGAAYVHFNWKAGGTVAEALVSAVRDIERAGFRAIGVDSRDLVTLKDIAARIDRSYEAVRLWSQGQRGPGGFPPPLSTADGWSLFSWAQVSRWLVETRQAPCVPDPVTRQLAIADHLVRTRALLATGSPMELQIWSELLTGQPERT